MSETKTTDPLQKIIDFYRQRAKSLRRKSQWNLALIGFLLLIGIAIFVFAGYITEKSNASKIDDIQYKMDLAASRMLNAGLLEKREVLDNQIKELKVLSDKLEKAKTLSGEATLNFLTTLSTRVGAILILIFLVQILIRLYRYDARLANYYDARANALEMHINDNRLPFDKTIGLVSPDMYDISSAKTPIDTMVTLVQSLNPNGKNTDK